MHVFVKQYMRVRNEPYSERINASAQMCVFFLFKTCVVTR